MYTIEVNYTTGSSLSSEEVTDDIGLVWEDKKLAQKALKSLKEHYTLYQELEGPLTEWCGRKNIEIKKDMASHVWCTDKNYKDRFWSKWACAVEMDDGEFRDIGTTMYCGYFETLHSAKVVTVNNEEDEDTVYFS